MKLTLKILTTVFFVLYPLFIYFGIEYIEPKYLALILLVAIFFRFLNNSEVLKSNVSIKWWGLLLAIAIVLIAFLTNSIGSLKVYPVIVNVTFLAIFGLSLVNPPSMIERFARLKEPSLDEEGIIYTRKITQIWCVFFLLNGLFSLYTAFYASIEFWTLYNGLISYCIMGMLFAGELFYRKIVLKK